MSLGRLELHQLLLEVTGIPNVYFQPPPNIQMEYPCVVYKRDTRKTWHADNHPYAIRTRYQVTIIDKNPDSHLPDLIASIPTSSFQTHYTADNLNHDVYSLYF